MAVALDATCTTAIDNTSATNPFNAVINLTVGAGANYLVVFCLFDPNSLTSISAHWDSAGTNQLMTNVGSAANSSGVCQIQAFELKAPTAGAKLLNVAWTGAKNELIIYAASFSGVDQTTPHSGLQTASGTLGANANTSLPAITSATGNAVVAAYVNDFRWATTQSNGTALAAVVSGTNLGGWANRQAGAASVTMAATNASTGGVNYCALGFNINAAAAGGPPWGWFRPSTDRLTPTRKVPIDAPHSFVSTFKTAGVSGIGWFEPPDRDPPPRRPTVESFSAWDPQVIQAAAAPTIGWFRPSDERSVAAKISDYRPSFFAPARPIIWSPSIPEDVRLPPRRQFDVPDYRPSFFTPAKPAIWSPSIAEDIRVLPRRQFDVPPAFGLAPPTAAVGISGIGWFEPPDYLPFKPKYFEHPPLPIFFAPVAVNWEFFSGDVLWLRDPPVDNPLAFTAPAPAPVSTIAGIAWFEPPDRNPPPRRPTVEQPPAFVAFPPAAPVRISGIAFQTPSEMQIITRFKTWYDYPPAWDPQFIVQITPPVTSPRIHPFFATMSQLRGF
jgi:hypothetical protein